MTIDDLIDGVIGREGGYTNNPLDRGGPTIWGITQQVARAFGYQGDMQLMPRDTAVRIYRQRYWTTPGFDQVAATMPNVAAEMFDCGVNMGPARAGGFLQRALNLLNSGATLYPDIATDGQIGPMTIHALALYTQRRGSAEGQSVLLWMIRAFRTGRYAEIAESNPSQETFEYGWVARQVRLAA